MYACTQKSITKLFKSCSFSAGGYYYSREIEPKLLDVNQHKIINPDIPSSFNDFKIVQFSDTHLGFHYDAHQLKKLVKKINALKPDIIFFTGDLMDIPNQYHESNIIILQNIRHFSYFIPIITA